MPSRKLPPPEVLRRHVFVEGMTYSEIAGLYACDTRTVPCTLRNDARRMGYPMTIIGTGTPEHARRVTVGRRKVRDLKCVDRTILRDVMRDFVKRHPDIALHRLADLSGLSRSWVWEVSRPNSRRPYISRTYAERIGSIMDLIDVARGEMALDHTEGDNCKGCDKIAAAKAKIMGMGVYPWMVAPPLNVNKRPSRGYRRVA
jgi:hypothetical protein